MVSVFALYKICIYAQLKKQEKHFKTKISIYSFYQGG